MREGLTVQPSAGPSQLHISAWPWILSLLPHPPLHYWVSGLYSVLYLWTLFAKHGRFYYDIFNVQVMFSDCFCVRHSFISFPFTSDQRFFLVLTPKLGFMLGRSSTSELARLLTTVPSGKPLICAESFEFGSLLFVDSSYWSTVQTVLVGACFKLFSLYFPLLLGIWSILNWFCFLFSVFVFVFLNPGLVVGIYFSLLHADIRISQNNLLESLFFPRYILVPFLNSVDVVT